VQERIAATAMLPLSHSEALQLQHYPEGQSYVLHDDYLPPAAVTSGQRIATFLLYLNDVLDGGEVKNP
jgi:prolyl 4-hydroxylase